MIAVHMLLAHPLTVRGELPVSPLVMAIGAVYLLFTVWALASRWERGGAAEDAAPEHRPNLDAIPASGAGRIAFWVVRAIGLALFVLALVAAWVGNPNQVRNIAPALTLGAGWPVLTLASLLLGRVWWWLNPFDTLARAVSPLGAGEGEAAHEPAAVWWAIPSAVAAMMYLTVWPPALYPRSLAVALTIYTFVTLAACLAVGRRTWMQRGEFFTVFFGLLAALRLRGARWSPPAGAPALLGVVSGAALFGLFRDSDLGVFLAYGTTANLYSRIAVALFMVVVAFAAEHLARRAVPGAGAMALAPMAAVLVVALSIARNRVTTSLQLLPIVASNPLGGGLDLFGTAANGLIPRPLGEVGPVWLQSGVLLLGAVAGVLLARRRAMQPQEMRTKRSGGIVVVVVGTLLGIAVAAAAAI